MTYLTAFASIFRFIRNYRERQNAREVRAMAQRHAERAHELEMQELLFTKLIELSKVNQEGILELARAQAASTEVMATWLKGFAISDPAPAAPQVFSDEDAWAREQQQAMTALAADSTLPPEFALALQLHQAGAAGFDREGSDF